jgi:hypothetical protein
VLVGHQACLGHGGGHTTWTCRTCDETVYGAAHRGTNCTNVEASQNYGICCAQRPDQAPAWLASRSARVETSMKKLAIRREHRINETQAESAIKDYVDHVADIAKFPDWNGGYPRLRHTPWRHPARQHRPRDRCRAGIQPTCPTTTDSRAAGACSPGAARKTAKPTHPALGASPRETGAVFDRTTANLRHGKGGKQRVVSITDTVDDDEIRAAMTAAVAG